MDPWAIGKVLEGRPTGPCGQQGGFGRHRGASQQGPRIGREAHAPALRERVKELEKEASSRYGIPFFQTSAWFGENVNEVRGVLQLPQAARPS